MTPLHHLRGSAAITAVLALLGTLLLATPAVAADPTLETTGFSVTSGATRLAQQPAADPTYLTDEVFAASPASNTVSSSFTYRCASDTEDCVDAAVTVSLAALKLSSPVVVDGLDVPPTITYWADAQATQPAAGYDTAAAFRVTFTLPVGDGEVGLTAGTIGTLKFDSTLIAPLGGGSQQGTAVVLPSSAAGTGQPSRIRVNGEFPVNLATTTAVAWARSSFLSGLDDQVDSPTNTATVTSTLSGDPADQFTVNWGGADPSTRPAAGTAGMLLDLTSATITGWPTGATSATVSGWTWNGSGSSAPVKVDLGTVTTGGTDLLAGLTPQVRGTLTGLQVVYIGSRIATGAASTLSIGVREHLSTNSTPVARNSAPVDYVTNAPAAAFDTASDLNTLTVTGAATSVAVRGTGTASSSDSKGFRVYDPRPYAGSTTALVGVNPGTIYGGGYVRLTSVGTNWSRRAVEQLTLTVPSSAAQVTATNTLLDPDLPAVDTRVFGAGLTFAGFGAGRSGAVADGTGLQVTGLTGAADLVLTVLTADGVGGSVTLNAASPVAPTDPAAFGLGSWSQVTGYTAVVRGTGSAVPMGATVTVPVLLRAATAAAATTYSAHTTAVAALGSSTSAVTPRTAQSGNRPVTAAQIAVAVPTVAVNGTKTVVEPYVSTVGGSVTAVLEAVSRHGASEHLPDTLTIEDSARLNSNAGAAWWNVFQPQSVEAPSGTVVEFYTNTTGAPVWQTYAGSLSALSGSDTWRGMRLVSHAPAGDTFPDGTVFRALVTFEVRGAVLNGQTWNATTSVTNVAEVTSSAAIEGNVVTSPVTRVTDTVTAVDPGTDGHHALVKGLSSTSGIEGSGATTLATLTWGTDGERHTAITVTDANGLTAANPTPSTGSSQSFWDSFNLTSVRPITSGPAAETGSAYDPYLAFDQVTDVRVFDTVRAEWISLKDQQWNGSAWVTRSGNRTDLRFGGINANGAFPYLGSFPGITSISAGVQARIGGIQLSYAPRSSAERTTAVAADDWRQALIPDLTTGAGADAVAAVDGPTRQIQLAFTLRDTSRANNAPINNAFVTNTGNPGRIANSGRVTGSGGDLGGPVNSSGWTYQVTAASVGVTAAKTWLRSSNGDPLKPSTDLDQLALPVEGQAAAADQWPTATLTVSGTSTATTRVDTFQLTEPAGIDSAPTLAANSPFAQFSITKISSLSDSISGSTRLDVVLYRVAGDGTISADPAITSTAAKALTAAQLTDVVGIQLTYTGRIAAGQRATMVLDTRLLAENRVTGADTVAGLRIDNTVRTTLWDARVCVAPETGSPSSCLPQIVSSTRTASVTVQDPEVLAVPALEVPTVDVQRDATTPTITTVLSVQNFGRTEADELLVTDADPRFFNAVAAHRITVDRLPTGAEEARLEVLLAGADLDIDTTGAYAGEQVWHSWATGTPGTAWDLDAIAASHGATAEQVIGVRVRFVSTDAQRITAPGQGYGELTMTGSLREELRTGGLPSAVGANGWRYQDRAELSSNPGETVRGAITNRISAQAIRDGLASVATDSAELAVTVHAGAATVRVLKAELNPAARKPGDFVQYRLAVTNTASGSGAADLTGLVVTDRLPEDGSLLFGDAPAGQQPWSVQGLGAPTVTADDSTITFAFGADERLAPGATVEILLWVRLAQDLSSVTIVNTASAASVSRPVVATSIGADGGTTCAPGSYDALAQGCVVSAGSLTIGGANVYVSEEWVRDSRTAAGAVRTTAAKPGTSGACAPRGTGADADWFRYPCSVVSSSGSVTDWQVQVTSRASVSTDKLELVDMLPAVGDYPAMASAGSRDSQWRPVWDGNLPALVSMAGLPAGAKLEVYTTTAQYRAGGVAASSAFDPVPGTWSSTPLTGSVPAAQAARVTGFKFVVSFAGADRFSSGESVRVGWSMRTPLTGATVATDTWNSFAFRVPADAAVGRPNDVTSVPLKAGARFAVAADQVGASSFAVGDRVWLDTNRDGIQDAGEPGVPGATVDLYAGSGAGATWAAEAASDANGEWLIDGLPAGSYQVRITLPADAAARYVFTAVDRGSDDAVDSDAVPDGDGDTALISSVELTDGAPNVSAGSAAWRAAHPGVTATLVDLTRDAGVQHRLLAVGDRVWFDTNRDGRQDPGEEGVDGAAVRLLSADGDVLADTTTDPDGFYRFTALDPGDYRVEVELPPTLATRWTFTATGVGETTGDSDATAVTAAVGRTGVFTLTAGSPLVTVSSLAGQPGWSGVTDADYADPTRDIGLAERPVRVGDRVWVDLNADGVQGDGEPGLAGVRLELTDAAGDPVLDLDGDPVPPVVSDADGGYLFDNLLPGQYQVRLTQGPDGYVPTQDGQGTAETDSSTGVATSRVLRGGEIDPSLDFGFRPLWAIGDRVWLDSDRDGAQDPGEPAFAGVTVRVLADDGTEVASVVTDVDGLWHADLLEPGDYTVEFELSAADAARYTWTTVHAAARADDDSDAAAVTPTLARATVTVGPDAPGMRLARSDDGVVASRIDSTWDAGLVEIPVAVGDRVWFDRNGDGVQDADEPGIAGAVLVLRTPDGHEVNDADGTPVGPVTTDADGTYRFGNLLPGAYVVSVDRVASGQALAGHRPTLAEVGSDRGADSSTDDAASTTLIGGQQDLTLDFGWVLADDVQLALRKSAVGRTLDSVTWELTVASVGTQDAYAGFTVVDTLPSGLRYTSASGDGFDCTVDGQVVTCDHPGALAAGETATVRIVTALTDSRASVRNTATVITGDHEYPFPVDPDDNGSWSDPVPPPVDDPAPSGPPVAGSAPAVPQAASGLLAITGSAPAGVIGGALVLTVAGLVLVLLRRRRPEHRARHGR
jgi:uncharacterized repeat protein (TIGR01451 family)